MTSPSEKKRSLLKDLPAVHLVLQWPGLIQAKQKAGIPNWALLQAVRVVLERQRVRILKGKQADAASPTATEKEILSEADSLLLSHLRPVINATGVILHTNLGRAPLADEAVEAVKKTARGYSNLEFDLDQGKRGIRYQHVEGLICELTGAESALVVNNNAAAVFLALTVLARDKEVIVSRGELVEIGGSFRIPDILRESGAVLVETGTTNRTHLKDYERAVSSCSGLLLKVHPSNYRVLGFQKEVSLEEMVALGKRSSLPVMVDLGSGCMLDPNHLGIQGEPSVRDVLKTGVDLVTFSGDKLLGGPQAGILLGQKEVVTRIQAHPLNRVLRIDKMTLSALEATLILYKEPETATSRIPTLAMLSTNKEQQKRKAQRLARKLKQTLPPSFHVALSATVSRAGGGSMPDQSIPGVAVGITSSEYSPDEILTRLRQASLPVIARIEKDEVLLDTRTLQTGDASRVCRMFEEAFGKPINNSQA